LILFNKTQVTKLLYLRKNIAERMQIYIRINSYKGCCTKNL